MFRSSVRARSSVERFPRAKSRKFWPEEDAERFLIENGVKAPEKYWKYEYMSGSLVRDPDSVTGNDVWFPVGNGAGDHGIVLDPVFEHDQWMWRVQMDNGKMDCMSEWPLLLGLETPASIEVNEEEVDSSSNQHPDTAIERHLQDL